MTLEALFNSLLDQHPDDQGARLLFAECLAECGDSRAGAYRWMAIRAKRPARDIVNGYHKNTWDWWSMIDGWKGESGNDNSFPDRVEPAIMQALAEYSCKSDWSDGCAYCEYRTRAEAEDALCRALAMLPETMSSTRDRR
jgi:uncharacterized protein (TIGR02996 family)